MAKYVKPLSQNIFTVNDKLLSATTAHSEQIGKTLTRILESNQIKCTPTDIVCSPMSVVYKYKVESYDIKKSKLKSIEETIPMFLNCSSVSIGFIPEEEGFAITIPNTQRPIVPIGNLFNTLEYQLINSNTKFVLGVDSYNKPVIMDFDKIPHMIISGTTGSGKSVALNVIISSILANATYNSVQFVMIDPKQVELAKYAKCFKFLNRPIANSNREALDALWEMKYEMDRRYKLFAENGVVNIGQYNELLAKKNEILPHLIVIVDELGDLMVSDKNLVQNYLVTLGQKSRAAGIHLICATQTPRAEIISGKLKANFTTQIAFQVQNTRESQIALGVNGAEKLLGKGDGLYFDSEYHGFRNFQSAMVTDEEIEKLIDFIENKSIID